MADLIQDITEEQAKALNVDQPKAEGSLTHPKPVVDLEVVYTMAQAKAHCKNGPVAGLKFYVSPDDNRFIKSDKLLEGTVLALESNREKVQAELTCANPECDATHIREVSDWHQSGFCKAHATAKGKLSPEEKAARLQAKAQAILAGK